MRIRGKAKARKIVRLRNAHALGLTAALLAAGASVAGATTTVTPPHVSTAGVEHVRGTSAQLDGVVNPNGSETSYYFQYGPTVAYGAQTKATAVGHGTTAVKVGQTVTGLLAGYHYRIVATAPNAENPARPFVVPGKDKQFSGGKLAKLKFVIAKGKEAELVARYGGSLDLAGSLKGLGFAGKALVLQSTPFPYTGVFSQVAGPVVSSRNGFFRFRVSHMKQSTEFRILTTDARPLYSPTVTVHVEPAISLRVQKLSGGRFRFYGTVQPASVHGSLVIQQLKPPKASSKKETPRFHVIAIAPIRKGGTTFSRF
ncbi:MAG: hypothetical protein ACYDC2_12090, partial [Solirubrobacteraceae bacterium]